MEVGPECISRKPRTVDMRSGFVREQEGGRLKVGFARTGSSSPASEAYRFEFRPEGDQVLAGSSTPYPLRAAGRRQASAPRVQGLRPSGRR